MRSLEIKRFGLCGDGRDVRVDDETLRRKLSAPMPSAFSSLAQALRDGMSIPEVFSLTKIDPWFLENIAQVVQEAESLAAIASAEPAENGSQAPSLTWPTRFKLVEPHRQARSLRRVSQGG